MMHSKRVWSLWDMLQFKAHAFAEAITRLNSLATLCGQLEAPPLPHKRNEQPGEEVMPNIIMWLDELATHLETVDARVSILAVTELVANIQEYGITWADLGARINEISNTLRRELSLAHIYFLPSTAHALLEDEETDEPKFGWDVDFAFPTAAYDIAEACNCLAFGRSTAAVFHLMRVMEIALRALNASLGLPDPTGNDRNWGNMLQAMKTDMEKRAQKANSGWANPADKELYWELHGSLDAVRSAWRNATMHIERRYDDEEAQHAFVVVKQFVKKLAERCDEEGEPKV